MITVAEMSCRVELGVGDVDAVSRRFELALRPDSGKFEWRADDGFVHVLPGFWAVALSALLLGGDIRARVDATVGLDRAATLIKARSRSTVGRWVTS